MSETPIPPNGYCYHSVGLLFSSDVPSVPYNIRNQINEFTSIVGKEVYSYFSAAGLTFSGIEAFWEIRPNTHDHKLLLDEGLIKAMGVILWPCLRGERDDDYTVTRIANGEYDSYIREQASQVKAFGYPFFIRFGHEMNIHQGSEYWNGAYSFARDPTTFVAAWRRYVDIFRSEGVSNASFIWNLNWGDIGPHHRSEYYPGDNYVDWVGISMYQQTSDMDPATQMEGIYNDYASKKPISIIEWGAGYWNGVRFSDSETAAYINRFFDAVEERPKIKMVDYWYAGDFKFDPTALPMTTEAYKNRIANPRYITEPTPTSPLGKLILLLVILGGVLLLKGKGSKRRG